MLYDLYVAIWAAELQDKPLLEAFVVEGVAALRDNFDTVSPDKVCQADRATVVLEGHRASFVFALYNSVVLIGREGRVL